MRNVLANVQKTAGPLVASIIRTIFGQPDTEHVRTQFDEVVRMLTRSHPKVAEMLDSANETGEGGHPRTHCGISKPTELAW